MGSLQADQNGMAIRGADPGSLLARMGLRSGDVLMSVNGQAVGTHSDLSSMLSGILQGSGADAYVLRDGHTIPLRLQFVPQPHREDQEPRS